MIARKPRKGPRFSPFTIKKIKNKTLSLKKRTEFNKSYFVLFYASVSSVPFRKTYPKLLRKHAVTSDDIFYQYLKRHQRHRNSQYHLKVDFH